MTGHGQPIVHFSFFGKKYLCFWNQNATERYIERSEPIELAVSSMLISHTRIKSCTACGIVPVSLQYLHRQTFL